jgi:hypothetical protein
VRKCEMMTLPFDFCVRKDVYLLPYKMRSNFPNKLTMRYSGRWEN